MKLVEYNPIREKSPPIHGAALFFLLEAFFDHSSNTLSGLILGS